MGRSADAAKVSVWRLRLKRFAGSGLSVARFCEAEGVSASSFFRWRKRIAGAEPEDDGRKASVGRRRAFAPVAVVERAALEAELPGGTRLRVPAGDVRLLRAAIRAIGAVDGRRNRGGAPC
jgi:hypothetical protein